MSPKKRKELGILVLLLVGAGILAVALALKDSEDWDSPTGPDAVTDAQAKARSRLDKSKTRRRAASSSFLTSNAEAGEAGEQERDVVRERAAAEHLKKWKTSDGRIEVRDGAIVVGLDYLVEQADEIVIGHIVDARSGWNEDQSLIFTTYTVSVEQELKGGAGDTVDIRVVGGKVGEAELKVTHQPHFELGDEGVFFIDRDPSLHTSLVGAAQGFLAFDHPTPETRTARDGFDRPIYGISEDLRFIDESKGKTLTSADELTATIKGLIP